MSAVVPVELDFPITVAGATVSVLSMRRPKVGDILVANRIKDEVEKEVHIFANLCQLSPTDIHSLDFKDYKKLQEAFLGFTS